MTLVYEDLTKMHPYFQRPYRWQNDVDADEAPRVKAEAEARWPGVRVTVRPYRP